MGILDFLGGKIVKEVGDIIDDNFTSEEEEIMLRNEASKIRLEETKVNIEDKKSARKMNSDLIASKDWLVRNTGSILAWFIVVGTFSLDYLVAFEGLKQTVGDKEVLMFILGSMNTYTAGVINFYFGSSKTEADAKRIING